MCSHKNLVKTFGIACMFFLFCITNVCAKDEVSAWVGISRIKMKDMRGMFDDSLLGNIKIDHSELAAPAAGLEYMHYIDNNFKISARVGVTGKKINFIPEGNLNLIIKDINSYCRIIIIPMMFGGSYSKKMRENFSLNGKLFLGYAFVDFESKNSFTLSEKIVKELNKTTGCFILDSSIGVEWFFTKRFGVGFDFGYRFTPEILPSKNIKLDFSGATFALNLNYKV
ncbi:MAG: hypothetical protein LBD57_06280 [Endomicrobium sp.]|jgi:hypothetical protein|uniref:hypothetical protein n=1 Tax=Candidatus Endomicrobiellum cubanum TaxID=3242325 RepID=UPI002830DF86|nr:hypothetical protein [Endomicrobium sp.]